ncbi:MAG: hypothetical protein AB1585_00735 [Thermodesulfobacteriota bacterium]
MTRRPLLLCLFFCLVAGIIFTWPMVGHFFSSIPYTLKPIHGYERVPLTPGDHLQAFYWYWLLSDNLFGPSGFLTNPYEFNGPEGPMSSVYAFFPFSLLYILLLPLGAIGAYNGLILLSFLLCGSAMFLLARTWTEDFWAALLAGLVFAAFPYRVSHIAGGQLTGHVILFLPLCLFFIEKTLATGRWVYGIAAGLCPIILSLMDPHTSYLMALTLAVYLPGRILLKEPIIISRESKGFPLWPGLLGALSGGGSLSLFLWIKYGNTATTPTWPWSFLQPVLLATLAVLLSWFSISALWSRWTTLSYAEARHKVGMSFFLFLPLLLYGLRNQLPVPRLGLIVLLLSLGLFFFSIFRIGIMNRDRILLFDWTRSLLISVSLGLGMIIAIVHLMRIRSSVLLPSVAGKGRNIGEVLLFSPKTSNLFFWQDINQEKFIIVGWGMIVLTVLGMILLLKRTPRNPGQLALAGVLVFLGIILSVGPRLSTFPLYQALYHYLPFFNYSRVPGRFLFIGMIFICLLAASALTAMREGLAGKGWVRLRKGLPLLIVPLVLFEYHTGRPLGMTDLPVNNQGYQTINSQLSENQRVLELPLWPGDSHQSSAYEYTVTRTRKPMINGYAPVVHRNYIDQIFWPLFPLDFGLLDKQQADLLRNLKVGLITFHDNAQIYPEKISPFPPRLALKRLMTSPFLKQLSHDQGIHLFKIVAPDSEAVVAESITSPVSVIFPANYLSQNIGNKEKVATAAGYYLLMEEKALLQGKTILLPGKAGNVASASPKKDRPGYLVISSHRFFPPGKYRARFRIKTGPTASTEEVGWIELLKDRETVLIKKVLLGRDLSPFHSWVEVPLDFEIGGLHQIGFRIHFSGQSSLLFNNAVIGFADQGTGPGSVEAEDLLRQTGFVFTDSKASGREAVLGKAGVHPPIYLCHGPYRTVSPGRYQVDFFLRLNTGTGVSPNIEVAQIEVATDMGKRIFNKKLVKAEELRTDRYQPVRLHFEIPFPCELEYRVKFLDQADILVDRITVSPSETRKNE